MLFLFMGLLMGEEELERNILETYLEIVNKALICFNSSEFNVCACSRVFLCSYGATLHAHED